MNNITEYTSGPYRFVIDTNQLNASYQALARELQLSKVGSQSVSDRTVTPPRRIPGKKGVALQIDGVLAVAKNLINWAKVTDQEIRTAFIWIARQILHDAVQHAPTESGQLRQGGRASVGGRLVARGREDGGIDLIPFKKGGASDSLSINVRFGTEITEEEGVGESTFLGGAATKRKRTTYRDKKGNVRQRKESYGQENDFLVAVWAHENLEYKPQTAGTGPKFLERALQKWEPSLRPKVVEALVKSIKEIRIG